MINLIMKFQVNCYRNVKSIRSWKICLQKCHLNFLHLFCSVTAWGQKENKIKNLNENFIKYLHSIKNVLRQWWRNLLCVIISPFTHIRLASINGIEYSSGKEHEYLMNKMSFHRAHKEARKYFKIMEIW